MRMSVVEARNIDRVAEEVQKEWRSRIDRLAGPPDERARQCLRLIERVIDLAPDEGTLHHAHKMAAKLRLPMSVVLDKLQALHPDLTIIEQAEMLGVTRQAIYQWRIGMTRPEGETADLLSRLTGFDADDIAARLTR
jgi:DNA-binding XRE family transcriptional regulator